MPIAVKALTTQTNELKSAGTTITLIPETDIDAYDLVVVMVAWDPSGNNVPTCIVTDNGGNTYTSLGAQLPAPATTSSATGVITQAFVLKYASNLVSPEITATFSVSITAKAISAYCFTGCSTTQRNTRTTSVGTTTGPALAGPSANVGDVTVAFGGWEQAGGNTFTSDTDTLNGSWSTGQKIGTTGGNTATNITIASQYKIQTTATGAQTWNGAMSASSNFGAHMYVLTPSTEQITVPTGILDIVNTGSFTMSASTTMSISGFTNPQDHGSPTVSRDIRKLETWGFLRMGANPPPGSSYQTAASSALDIKNATGTEADGVYWINLPTVGPTQTYCIMNSAYNGGGWMMAMKATTGTTFQYSSTHWTTATTLNPTATNQSNGDAKFNTMNYFLAKDMLAVWPDITTGTGGSITGLGKWIWLQNNFFGGNRTTMISLFSTQNRYFIQDAKTYSGWASGIFSSQTDIRFYGYNWTDNVNMRWGFGWNENGGGLYPNGVTGSDDVSGGIGMGGFGNYSAGDYISCCQDTTGINRSARVEVYIR